MRGTIQTVVAACALALACVPSINGCSSSTVKVDGGVGLLGSRRVHVGDVFEISQPFDERAGAEWRLTRYDSAIVYPHGLPRVEAGSDGSLKRIIPFVAKAPGATEMEFTRRNLHIVKFGEPAPEPELKRIRIRVVS